MSPRAPRGLSQDTLRLLGEAERAAERRTGLRSATAIAGAGEPRAILYLRELLLHRGPGVRDGASEAIEALLALLQPLDFPWFDDLMRHGWVPGLSRLPSVEWGRMGPRGVDRLIRTLRDPAPFVTLCLSHRNGHIRQIAIERPEIDRARAGRCLLAIRLRDWVPEVRAAALHRWRRVLRGAGPSRLVELLGIALRLEDATPTPESADGFESLEAHLREKGGAGLLQGAQEGNAPIRRYCLGKLLTSGGDAAALGARALLDPDPLVQEWALRGPFERLDGDARLALLARAARTARSRVRSIALQMLWHHDPELAEPILREALLAGARSVRAFAIWALEGSGLVNSAAFYRGRLPELNGRRLAAAVWELGRRGDDSDVTRIVALLREGQPPRVQAAALRALGRLAPEQARQQYVSALLSPSARVARAARDVAQRDRGRVPCVSLAELARGRHSDHTRRHALSVVRRRCPKWFKLTVLLELVVEADGLQDVARRAVGEWISRFNRSTVRPTADEQARIAALLRSVRGHLPQAWMQQLDFFIT